MKIEVAMIEDDIIVSEKTFDLNDKHLREKMRRLLEDYPNAELYIRNEK